MSLKKKIEYLQSQISLYLENWFNENNKKEELFELLGWKNFLEFATGLSEKERLEKYRESNIEFTHIYIK